MSLRRWSRSSMLETGLLFTVITAPLGESSIPSTTWLLCCGCCCCCWVEAWGRAMSSPFWASGVTTMKMMSSTSITSMSGVMLMSPIASLDDGRVASCEWTMERFLWWPRGSGVSRKGTGALDSGVVLKGGFGLRGPLISSARGPRLGDERDLFHARLAREVHDFHDLGVGQLLVGLEVDDLPALGQVLEALLELGDQVGL